MTEKQKVISLRRQGYSYRVIRGETHIDKDTAARYVAEYNTQRAECLAANPDTDGDGGVRRLWTRRAGAKPLPFVGVENIAKKFPV